MLVSDGLLISRQKFLGAGHEDANGGRKAKAQIGCPGSE